MALVCNVGIKVKTWITADLMFLLQYVTIEKLAIYYLEATENDTKVRAEEILGLIYCS